jgi:hypothetical protein
MGVGRVFSRLVGTGFSMSDAGPDAATGDAATGSGIDASSEARDASVPLDAAEASDDAVIGEGSDARGDARETGPAFSDASDTGSIVDSPALYEDAKGPLDEGALRPSNEGCSCRTANRRASDRAGFPSMLAFIGVLLLLKRHGFFSRRKKNDEGSTRSQTLGARRSKQRVINGAAAVLPSDHEHAE